MLLQNAHVSQPSIISVYVFRPLPLQFLYAPWASPGFPWFPLLHPPAAVCKKVSGKENVIDPPARADPNLFPTSHDSRRSTIHWVVPSRRLQGGWGVRVESSFTIPVTKYEFFPVHSLSRGYDHEGPTHIRSPSVQLALRLFCKRSLSGKRINFSSTHMQTPYER